MTTKNLKILLVEDDANLGFLLSEFLGSKGFRVSLFKDGKEGLDGFKIGDFDFCLLDVMLPKMDGFELARNIREINEVIPIVMLTAKNQDEDKIKGFSIGIDDYITKPFNEEELVCRIQAIISRMNRSAGIKAVDPQDHRIGIFEFECKNQLLKTKDDQRRLTKTESEVLQVLCNSTNSIISRKEVMETVWGEDDYFVGRSLDVFVSKLRKYLSEDPRIRIDTIPKVGLVLRIED